MYQQSFKNKGSILLCDEENEHLFALIGDPCQAIATGVVELYVTESPHHSQWIKQDTGILCFIKDNFRKGYFFRLYCLERGKMIWEQEKYNNMEYISLCEYLHTFEGEGCMIAFNFANVIEANEFKLIVDQKLLAMKKRQERKSTVLKLQEPTPRLPTTEDLVPVKKTVKGKTKRKQLTKADIGNPAEFRHVTHIGFDPNKGFDVDSEDPHMNKFFEKAGVSEKELKNKNTRKFIYDFINEHGGREAVQQDVQKPKKQQAPVPPIAPTGPWVAQQSVNRSHGRTAPPPPPNSTQTSRKPPNSKNSGIIPPAPPLGVAPPPAGVAPPPPPPPPPPPTLHEMPPANLNQTPGDAPDMRSALMDSIRGGKTLKPVEAEAELPDDNPRDDLLSEIRKGFHLKPANEREVKPVSPPIDQGHGDLASALARALEERKRVIQSEDESTSDTDSNDDEWGA